jgi:hypothetical protein
LEQSGAASTEISSAARLSASNYNPNMGTIGGHGENLATDQSGEVDDLLHAV